LTGTPRSFGTQQKIALAEERHLLAVTAHRGNERRVHGAKS
jgi:hypothetical protein